MTINGTITAALPETNGTSNKTVAHTPTEGKELNLCELLAGHEGEMIFLTTLGNVIIHSVSERSVQLKTHETAKDIHWLPSSGKLHKNGLVIAFPSRALYEQYPLDSYTAWMEWQEEQKKYALSIAYVSNGIEAENFVKTLFKDAGRVRYSEIKAVIEKYRNK